MNPYIQEYTVEQDVSVPTGPHKRRKRRRRRPQTQGSSYTPTDRGNYDHVYVNQYFPGSPEAPNHNSGTTSRLLHLRGAGNTGMHPWDVSGEPPAPDDYRREAPHYPDSDDEVASNSAGPSGYSPTASSSLAVSSPMQASERHQTFKATFYERLALLHALDPVQGKRKAHAKTVEAANLTRDELRREFLNSIAYVCDTQKGGKTCTAAALQEKDGSKILILASNSKVINPHTLASVRQIVVKLARHDGEHSSAQRLETELIKTMVDLSGGARMKEYLRHLWINYRDCVQNSSLVKGLGPDFECILTLLGRLFDFVRSQNITNHPLTSPPEPFNGKTTCPLALERAVIRCYVFAKMKEMSRLRQSQEDNNRSTSLFQSLRHNIGRLAKFRTVAKILVKTAKAHSDIFPDLKVAALVNPGPERGPLKPLIDVHLTLRRIVGDVVGTSDHAVYLHRVETFNRPHEMLRHEGSKTIYQEFAHTHAGLDSSSSCKKRLEIHAELLLLEHVQRTAGFQFVGNDRYIGCSKLSCYLCDRYFDLMAVKIKTQPTHNKIWPAWRLPGGMQEDEEIDFFRRMTEFVDKGVKTLLDDRNQRIMGHTDSTTGVTCPSYHSDLESLNLNAFDSDVGEASDDDGGFMTGSEYGESAKPERTSTLWEGQSWPGTQESGSGLKGTQQGEVNMPGAFPV